MAIFGGNVTCRSNR